MAKKPTNNGRRTDGKFAPGNKLGGGKPGARHKVTRAVEALLEGEHEALTRKAIEKAIEGDTTALRLCLERLAPVRKDSPITFDLPPITSAAEVVIASGAVLSTVATGEITPDEAGRVMALLTAHRAIIETGDLADRVAALEAARAPTTNNRR